eukprot:GSChrysophyteH1.ASY1.ANO1.1615.1 assembled CDS
MPVLLPPYAPDVQLDLDNPKRVTPAHYSALFQEYLLRFELDSVEELLMKPKDVQEKDVALEIFYTDLAEFDGRLALILVHHPNLLMSIFNDALYDVQKKVFAHEDYRKRLGNTGEARSITEGGPKTKCQIRILALPAADKGLTKGQISLLRADEVNKLVQFVGTIVRSGARKLLDLSKEYMCQRCGHRVVVRADPEQENLIPELKKCQVTGSAIKLCGSTTLREVEGSRRCVDYQEIKIQDQMERVELGCIPRSITVILEADLVDKFNAGDDVIVVGQLLRRWRPLFPGNRCQVDIAVKANTNIIDSDMFKRYWAKYAGRESMAGRNIIVKSICPQLYGLFYVKLALILTLIGGTTTKESAGVKRRQQSHLLLIGDPGCGKSQLLKCAASLVSRSVLTTGLGTTGAGLTCSAFKDEEGEYQLEAGALVLSNNGVCCIDEFSSVRKEDQGAMHEVMEQQTLSVAKAGNVAKLNARCTIVACCNPKGGKYDLATDLPSNVNISTTLLSRFDLVLVLLDAPDKSWDSKLFCMLLSILTPQTPPSCVLLILRNFESLESGACWAPDELRVYLAHVKSSFQPSVSSCAKILLSRFYGLKRQSGDRSASLSTVRLLESLIRLSEAHAKLMCRNTVDVEDAVMAITLVSLSQTEELLLSGADSALHTPFPEHSQAMQLYAEQEAKVFQMLHCTRASLEAEAIENKSGSKQPISTKEYLGYENIEDLQQKNFREVGFDERKISPAPKRPRIDKGPSSSEEKETILSPHVMKSEMPTSEKPTANVTHLVKEAKILSRTSLEEQQLRFPPEQKHSGQTRGVHDAFSLDDEDW